ncbi:MAG: YfiH family protein [Urechidicola sp.]|jgi:YfiH family protein
MQQPEWSIPSTVKALYTTRSGGVSQAPFDSFNLAEHVGDEPDRVARNRDILIRSMFNQDGLLSQSLPAAPSWLQQTHSTTVVTLESEPNREADAAITRQADTVAVVMTADCLPILLCNRSGTEVSAVHAGWRGLLDGIVQTTIIKMQSPPSELMAWIGPAISQPKFEVGDEVRQAFVDKFFEIPAPVDNRFISNRPGHWLCDLPALADDLLKHLGVADVTQSNLCSYCNEADFFSYRRKAVTGRMASLIWIPSNA